MPATTALLLGTQQRPPGRALLALPPPQRPVAAAGPVALSTRPPAGRLTGEWAARLLPTPVLSLLGETQLSPGATAHSPPPLIPLPRPTAAAAPTRCRLGPAASTALGAQSDDSPGCLEQVNKDLSC